MKHKIIITVTDILNSEHWQQPIHLAAKKGLPVKYDNAFDVKSIDIDWDKVENVSMWEHKMDNELILNGRRFKMTKFVREERYIVLKIKYLTEDEILNLYSYNHAMVECVVVESDWPEYEAVWKMIEERVNGEG